MRDHPQRPCSNISPRRVFHLLSLHIFYCVLCLFLSPSLPPDLSQNYFLFQSLIPFLWISLSYFCQPFICVTIEGLENHKSMYLRSSILPKDAKDATADLFHPLDITMPALGTSSDILTTVNFYEKHYVTLDNIFSTFQLKSKKMKFFMVDSVLTMNSQTINI